MFPKVWQNKCILYELLKYNHNNQAETVADINHLSVLKYYVDLEFDKVKPCYYLLTPQIAKVPSIHDCSINRLAKNGQLEMLKWVHYNGGKCTSKALYWATVNGHLKVVKWLYGHLPEFCVISPMDAAIENNHLHIVKIIC